MCCFVAHAASTGCILQRSTLLHDLQVPPQASVTSGKRIALVNVCDVMVLRSAFWTRVFNRDVLPTSAACTLPCFSREDVLLILSWKLSTCGRILDVLEQVSFSKTRANWGLAADAFHLPGQRPPQSGGRSVGHCGSIISLQFAWRWGWSSWQMPKIGRAAGGPWQRKMLCLKRPGLRILAGDACDLGKIYGLRYSAGDERDLSLNHQIYQDLLSGSHVCLQLG